MFQLNIAHLFSVLRRAWLEYNTWNPEITGSMIEHRLIHSAVYGHVLKISEVNCSAVDAQDQDKQCLGSVKCFNWEIGLHKDFRICHLAILRRSYLQQSDQDPTGSNKKCRVGGVFSPAGRSGWLNMRVKREKVTGFWLFQCHWVTWLQLHCSFTHLQ